MKPVLVLLAVLVVAGCAALVAQPSDPSRAALTPARSDVSPAPTETSSIAVTSTTSAPTATQTPTTSAAPLTTTTTAPPTTTAVPTTTASTTTAAAAAQLERTTVAHADVDTIIGRGSPEHEGDLVGIFSNPTDDGGPLVFQTVLRAPPADADWIEVFLPVRPNGSTGWIPREQVSLTRNPYRIEVDTEGHELRVYRDGELAVSTAVGIGTGATPTPIGSFYLTTLLRPADPTGPYGPLAYGLSGYSNELFSFGGGAGVIGIHGTDRPDLIGGDVSHGCIRVPNSFVEELATFLPLGTPVIIT